MFHSGIQSLPEALSDLISKGQEYNNVFCLWRYEVTERLPLPAERAWPAEPPECHHADLAHQGRVLVVSLSL